MMVRESSVSFSPRPFAPQPVTRVRWRGTGCSCPTISLLCNSISASPSISLVCDSISASKSKCGYPEWSGHVSSPPKIYLVYDLARTGSWSGHKDIGGSSGPPDFTCVPVGSNDYSESVSQTTHSVYSASCAFSSTSTASSARNQTGVTPCSSSSISCWVALSTIDAYCGVADLYSDTTSATSTTKTRTITASASHSASAPPDCTDCSSSGSDVTTETLSSEYTTATLISNAVAALPSYAGFGGSHGSGQGTTCSATRALATDETSYSIRRFKYKFTFAAATAAYTISWNEHFVPTSGSPTDTPRTASVSIGDTETSVLEVTEGTVNGTTTITDITITVTDLGTAYAACFNCVLHGSDPVCDASLTVNQGCTCSAFLSAAGAGKFKYKFRFKGSPTAYLKLLWNETFRPTLTSTVTYCGSSYATGTEDPDPSHWTVTAKSYTKTFAKKCQKPIAAPTLPKGDSKEWESGIYTVAVPGTKGTTYITDIRWSIVNTYNPTASSIPGVDQFAGSSTNYLCNSRTAAQRNCTPAP